MLIKDIRNHLENYLMPYLSTLHDYSVYIENERSIIITGKLDKKDIGFNLLCLMIQVENEEFLISQIYIPSKDRGNRIGMQLLKNIFLISKSKGYGLALVQMVNSFIYQYIFS